MFGHALDTALKLRAKQIRTNVQSLQSTDNISTTVEEH